MLNVMVPFYFLLIIVYYTNKVKIRFQTILLSKKFVIMMSITLVVSESDPASKSMSIYLEKEKIRANTTK
jgi:hypothetical protein